MMNFQPTDLPWILSNLSLYSTNYSGVIISSVWYATIWTLFHKLNTNYYWDYKTYNNFPVDCLDLLTSEVFWDMISLYQSRRTLKLWGGFPGQLEQGVDQVMDTMVGIHQYWCKYRIFFYWIHMGRYNYHNQWVYMLEVHLMLSRLPGIHCLYYVHLIWNWQWVCWSWWWWSTVEIFVHNVWRWSCQSSVPPNHKGKNSVYPRYQNTEMLSLSSVPHQHLVSVSIQIQTIR